MHANKTWRNLPPPPPPTTTLVLPVSPTSPLLPPEKKEKSAEKECLYLKQNPLQYKYRTESITRSCLSWCLSWDNLVNLTGRKNPRNSNSILQKLFVIFLFYFFKNIFFKLFLQIDTYTILKRAILIGKKMTFFSFFF